MHEFIWIPSSVLKVANHLLSLEEVEFAWKGRVDFGLG